MEGKQSTYARYTDHPGRGFVVEARYLGAAEPFHRSEPVTPKDASEAFRYWTRKALDAGGYPAYNVEVTLTALLRIDAYHNRRFVFEKGLPHAMPDPRRG